MTLHSDNPRQDSLSLFRLFKRLLPYDYTQLYTGTSGNLEPDGSRRVIHYACCVEVEHVEFPHYDRDVRNVVQPPVLEVSYRVPGDQVQVQLSNGLQS